ncbi:MAG: colanic acid biosynthesis fucosyltransferase WcaI [Phototrophicales bacterium]
MARVLVLSMFFSPDGLSTATIVSELAQDLKTKGHDLKVIATVPHYNYEPEARTNQPLKKRWFGLYHRSEYHDIPVWHTTIGPRRKRGKGRTFIFLIYNLVSLLLGLFAIGKQDVILVVSPPLTSGVVGRVLAIIKRAKLIYNVQELYPETYITMGAMNENSLPAKILFRIERFVYRTADALTPIGQIFADAIKSQKIPAEKIHVIPNFVDTDFLKPLPKDNPLAHEFGLVDSFVVLYAGNIGLSQSFDTLLEVAQRLKHTPQIKILIVGDGVRRGDIEQQAAVLPNVILLPYQPRSRVPEIYGTADLGLVPLMKGTAKTTLPSKLYTIMATGTPALVAVDPDSDIVRQVNEAQAGIVIPPDDADALEQAIRYAHANLTQTQQYGHNGREYALQHFSRRRVVEQYHALICNLTQTYS